LSCSVFQGFAEDVPRQAGALDPHRVLPDPLEGLEITERSSGSIGVDTRVSPVIERHETAEFRGQVFDLGAALALDRLAIIGRGKADRAPWPSMATGATIAVGSSSMVMSSPQSGFTAPKRPVRQMACSAFIMIGSPP
jgi:hypothetical protein